MWMFYGIFTEVDWVQLFSYIFVGIGLFDLYQY